MLILVFVGVMYAYVAIKIFTATERKEVFNRRPIEVLEVKHTADSAAGWWLALVWQGK